MADEVPELISELKKRTTLIQHLEAQIIAAKRTPDDLAALVTRIEDGAPAKLADLRSALAEQRDLRQKANESNGYAERRGRVDPRIREVSGGSPTVPN